MTRNTVTPRRQMIVWVIRDHGCFAAHHQTKRRSFLLNHFGDFNRRGSAGRHLGPGSRFVEPMRPVLPREQEQGGIVGRQCRQEQGNRKGGRGLRTGIERVTPLADYLVVNISSPNTEGLRDLQARQSLETLLTASLDARARSLPDATQRPPAACESRARPERGRDGRYRGSIADNGHRRHHYRQYDPRPTGNAAKPGEGRGRRTFGQTVAYKVNRMSRRLLALDRRQGPACRLRRRFFRRRRLCEDQSRCLPCAALHGARFRRTRTGPTNCPRIGGFT